MGLITLATKKLCAIFLLAFALAASFQSAAEEELVPMCERTPEVVKAFEQATELPCDQILEKWSFIDRLELHVIDDTLSNEPIEFKVTDFAGPFRYDFFQISFSHAKSFSKDYLAFLPELESLSLYFGGPTKFAEGSLRSSQHIQRMTLISSRKVRIEKGVLQDFPRLTDLTLNTHQLNYIADNAFVELKAIRNVDVRLAPLRETSRAAFTGVLRVKGLRDGFGDPQQSSGGTWD